MSVSDVLKQRAITPGFWLGFASYVVPSFPIAYVWHLIAFAPAYHELAMYRDDVIVPFGLFSMLIQGAAFSFVYPRVFSERRAVMKERPALWSRACAPLLVVHDARRGGEECHEFSADLSGAGDQLYSGAVRDRGTTDCARVPKMMESLF